MKIIRGFKDIFKGMNWYNRDKALRANCKIPKKELKNQPRESIWLRFIAKVKQYAGFSIFRK